MGRAERQSRVFAHPVHTCGSLGVTTVAVTPDDPLVNTLKVATASGWWDGRLVRLPSWTGVRTGLGVVVARDVASVPWYLARLAFEVTVLAAALTLAVSSLW